MWVMATSPKNYIALFSFQRPGQGVKPDGCKTNSGVGTLEELLNGAVAQLARAPALQAGCRGFEPHQLHHTTSRWRDDMNREGV